jgi:pyruvate ferredoxin oxidoreductase delta subunit
MAYPEFDVTKEATWKPSELPIGFVIPDGGNSVKYLTGGWRSQRPIWDKDACKNCMLCWVYCPDASIIAVDKEMTGIDYDHCKGCGVCVNECKFGALKMITESEAKEVYGE